MMRCVLSNPYGSGQDRRGTFLAAGLICIAVLVAHAPALQAPFLYDDFTYFVHNQRLRSLAWPWMFLAGTTRPALFLTLAANRALCGPAPAGYHLANVAVIALAGLTLFGLLRRTLRLACPSHRSRAWPSAATILAGAGALAWAAHPLQANVTAYVWQRGEALMALCYLLSLYAFARAATAIATATDQADPLAARAARVWSLLAMLACVLGMACKEVMASAPIAILLYDRAFLAGSLRRAWRLRWRLHLGLFASWGILAGLAWANASRFHDNVGVGFSSAVASPARYLATMPGAWLEYLRLAVAPFALCFDPNRQLARTAADALLPLCVLLPLLAAVIAGLARNRAWGFAGAWFILILAPTSSFMPMPDPLLEYRMCLPLAALAMLATLAGAGLAGGSRRFAVAAVATLIAIALGFLCNLRCRDFASAGKLWADTLRKRPNNLRAWENLWTELQRARDNPELENRLERELADAPDRLDLWLLLARFDLERGDLARARNRCAQALDLDPQAFLAHYMLGQIAWRSGDADGALGHFARSVEIRPLFAMGYSAAGEALLSRGEHALAMQQAAEAVRIWPRWPQGHLLQGRILLAGGRPAEAISTLRAAARLLPGNAAIYALLGQAWLEAGDPAGACHPLRLALELDPGNPRYRLMLERARALLGGAGASPAAPP